MTLTVIGAGYVGLVSAAVFSDFGNKVFCIDINKGRIKDLEKGKIPFFEPQLDEFIKRNLKSKRLFFTTSYSESVPKSQVILVCVGTPPKNNGEADLSYLFGAVEEASKHFSGYTLIVIKSTVPVGFEDDLERTVKKYAKSKFEFAACPEFLREGTAIEDTLHPDRIVIGASSKKAQKILLELHAPISGERILCDVRSAQLIKYASNALLATKVSFANAIAAICEKTGANVEKVLAGVGADRRIGRPFLYPGVGYGGSCLPKDVLAFIAIARSFNYDFHLLRSVESINEGQISLFINKVRSVLDAQEEKGENLSGKKLAVLGLAFKPDTDDMRDAPSVKIIRNLIELGAEITAYDPQAMENARKILPKITYAKNEYDAVRNMDAILIVTEWTQFAELDLQRIKKLVKKPIIVDGRNFLKSEKVKRAGFIHIKIGA